ncbi:MAG: hypothetical protein ABIY55_28745 [Kofleriaceae bacterium]
MSSKATVWQIYVIGVTCLGAGAAMMYLDLTMRSSSFGHVALGQGVALMLLLGGAWVVRLGFIERARQRAGVARPERPRVRRRRPVAGLEPAPRLGNDPFRDPPVAAPIVVERHPTAPVAAPIVTPIGHDDPRDRPKLLR